jgi:hypothetical protein
MTCELNMSVCHVHSIINGLIEGKFIILNDMAKSMHSEYNMSDVFWAEAIDMPCHTIESRLEGGE